MMLCSAFILWLTAIRQTEGIPNNAIVSESSPTIDASSCNIGSTNGAAPFEYPYARRDESFTETSHGERIPDPYRWLEKPSEETREFVKAQNDLSRSYIRTPVDDTSNDRALTVDKFQKILTEICNREKSYNPFKVGDSYYYFHNSGLQPYFVLYKKDSLNGESRVFFDTNTLSSDNSVALTGYKFSEDGAFFAYILQNSGSDWQTIHIRSTADDATEDLDKPIEWVKFTDIQWTHDNKGIFYNLYAPPAQINNDGVEKGTETDMNTNPKVMYHVIGSEKEDVLIHQDKENPKHGHRVMVSDDGEYLILNTVIGASTNKKVYIAHIGGKDIGKISAPLPWDTIVDDFSAAYDYITNEGTIFYFRTTLNAPRKRLVKYDLEKPELGMIEVISETEDLMQNCFIANKNKLIIPYLQNVKHIIKIYELPSGTLLPHNSFLEEGSIISSIHSRKDQSEVFYLISSFLTPAMVVRFDFTTMESSVLKTTDIKNHDPTKYQVKQIRYKSTGDAMVPMYIISKKNTPLDGNNPTLLYAYGGFNVPILPAFKAHRLAFIEHMNGVFCVANIRGGGEFGQKWYKDGILGRKQNGIDDLLNAARYLIDEKWTKPSKLAINGASNGGMMVAACANQNPELFGCVVADVGVMDLTRFHKFTIGHAWTCDYGDPENKDEFQNLIKFSPLHNVREQKYPGYLITTSDHDDRVVPLHSYKMIAALQHAVRKFSEHPPVMMRVQVKAGHGHGQTLQTSISEEADKLAFMAKVLNVNT